MKNTKNHEPIVINSKAQYLLITYGIILLSYIIPLLAGALSLTATVLATATYIKGDASFLHASFGVATALILGICLISILWSPNAHKHIILEETLTN
ncbi:hypothetical protein [Lysinibacillus irui]|uniref:Uncharacterized protein n=1 Tax=Lysinibacillus irui TaxID=2998077 RepID=A0AAJ5RZW7_9BACI|nr:hypothetical protein [Lysinibacillus irui]WDV09214.1 hypothetical protein OU989_23285 [Lysinibacillus irui]